MKYKCFNRVKSEIFITFHSFNFPFSVFCHIFNKILFIIKYVSSSSSHRKTCYVCLFLRDFNILKPWLTFLWATFFLVYVKHFDRVKSKIFWCCWLILICFLTNWNYVQWESMFIFYSDYIIRTFWIFF